MGMFEDVLAWVDNKRRVAGRNVSDLWNDPANALQKTADNTLQTVRELPNDPANFLFRGATAWHGSPHKFDKFAPIEKVRGTGEGAQAYGDGHYLGGARATGEFYRDAVSDAKGIQSTLTGAGESIGIPKWAEGKVNQDGLDSLLKEWELRAARERSAMTKTNQPWINEGNAIRFEEEAAKIRKMMQEGGATVTGGGYLYKTDIPDEAVARFLDWDKPLSQQPEVLAQLQGSKNKQIKAMLDFANKEYQSVPGEFPTAGEAFKLMSMNHTGRASADSAKASALLAQQGIPGIRYLDGGSRSAGQGSSNFVVFDPEMIRILERNGQATGKMPWKPGEFDIFKDTTYEPPLFPDTTR